MVQTRKKSFKKNKGKGNVQKRNPRKTRTGTRKRKYRGGSDSLKSAQTTLSNVLERAATKVKPKNREKEEQLRSISGREIYFQEQIFEKLREIKNIMQEEGERSLSNQTLLHIVAHKGNESDAFDIMKMLLQDVDAQPKSKLGTMTYTLSTPLYDAVESGNIEMVKLLIKKGADKNKKGGDADYQDFSPIEYVDANIQRINKKLQNTHEEEKKNNLLNRLNTFNLFKDALK